MLYYITLYYITCSSYSVYYVFVIACVVSQALALLLAARRELAEGSPYRADVEVILQKNTYQYNTKVY